MKIVKIDADNTLLPLFLINGYSESHSVIGQLLPLIHQKALHHFMESSMRLILLI